MHLISIVSEKVSINFEREGGSWNNFFYHGTNSEEVILSVRMMVSWDVTELSLSSKDSST
jgi:hypothetical protein